MVVLPPLAIAALSTTKPGQFMSILSEGLKSASDSANAVPRVAGHAWQPVETWEASRLEMMWYWGLQ